MQFFNYHILSTGQVVLRDAAYLVDITEPDATLLGLGHTTGILFFLLFKFSAALFSHSSVVWRPACPTAPRARPEETNMTKGMALPVIDRVDK